MALTYFTVTGNYNTLAGAELWDLAGGPPLRPVSGAVTFTPMFNAGEAAKNNAGVLVLQPVPAVVKDGVLSRNGVAGCKLIANVDLGLEELFYRVTFFGLRAVNGEEVILNNFDFLAPTSATTVDLGVLNPVAGAPAIGRPSSSVTSTVVSAPVPATATAAGTPGQVAYTDTHVYICTAVNTWRRASLSSW